MSGSRPERDTEPDSPILPKWDPFAIPGSRLADSFAPILSFLLLVALFTVAGTSILMLRKSDREPAPPANRSATKQGVRRALAGPRAYGPRGLPKARLEVDTAIKRQSTASSSPPAGLPKTHANTTESEAAASDVTNLDITPPASTTPEAHDYPRPGFPETSARPLPQAQMSDSPAAVARLSGGIQEITAPR